MTIPLTMEEKSDPFTFISSSSANTCTLTYTQPNPISSITLSLHQTAETGTASLILPKWRCDDGRAERTFALLCLFFFLFFLFFLVLFLDGSGWLAGSAGWDGVS